MEFDNEFLLPIALALVGAFVAFFTCSGGFSSWPEGTGPGMITKLAVTAGGAAIGFVWGRKMQS